MWHTNTLLSHIIVQKKEEVDFEECTLCLKKTADDAGMSNPDKGLVDI